MDALGHGDQILILRKGGISEGRGGFKIEHSEFLLFPTLFHQQRESVLPEAQTRYDQIAPLYQDATTLRIEYFVRVTNSQRLQELPDAERLRGQHVWKDEVIAQRFDWGRDKSIYAMAVRVYRLPKAVMLPMSPAYGGCKSWIEFEREIDMTGAEPVLDETAFAARLTDFKASLQLAGLPE